MAYINYSRELLDRFCMEAFQKFGFTEQESRIISDVLLMSDDFGIESHGMQRLVRYHKGIESGLIHVDAKPEVVLKLLYQQLSMVILEWDNFLVTMQWN